MVAAQGDEDNGDPPPTDEIYSEMSDNGTASMDWETPCLTLDSISDDEKMQDAVLENDKTDKAVTSGRIKVQRELKIAGPYDTHRQRLGKIFSTTMMILGGIFLLNAVIVSFSLWRLSKLEPEDLDIRRVELYDLESEIAHASLEVHLPGRWYFYMFRVTMHEPTTVHIYAPEAIRNDEQKWTPILTVQVPTVVVGRSATVINLRDIPIQYGRVPLKDLIDYFGDFSASIPRRVMVRVEFEVDTTSYWIPIRFSHAIEQEVVLPQSPSVESYPMPVLEGVEFVDNPQEATTRLATRLHIEYPRRDIPHYLYVKVPELFVDVGYFVESAQKALALSSNAVAQVKIRQERNKQSSYSGLG